MADAAARKEMGDQAEEIQAAPRTRQQIATTDDIEDDPHRAALELNPEVAEKITWSTIMAVFVSERWSSSPPWLGIRTTKRIYADHGWKQFLGLSFTACISTAFLLASSILVPIGMALGDLEPIGWIASSWALTSAVTMSLGGGLSDIFGRRYIILIGQVLNIIGAIVSATAQKTTHVIAGSAIIGFGTGFIF